MHEEKDPPPPYVGALVVRDGVLLGEGHRGQTGDGDHAEFGLLRRLEGQDLSGADMYTTLEPCSRRGHGKTPCAERLVSAGIATVWIGVYDPNPAIYRQGWRILRKAGVAVRDFHPDFRAEIRAQNWEFLDQYRTRHGEKGRQTFDYLANTGTFVIDADGLEFSTKWSNCSTTQVYAYDAVALAKGALDFDEIDDPSGLDYGNRVVAPHVGEIISYRADRAYLLLKIVQLAAPEGPGAVSSLTVEWEARLPTAGA